MLKTSRGTGTVGHAVTLEIHRGCSELPQPFEPDDGQGRRDDNPERVAAAISLLQQRLGRPPNVSELAVELDIARADVIDIVVRQNPGQRTPAASGSRFRAPCAANHEMVPQLPVWLPSLERTVLLMRIVESLPQSEIAARLGISPSRVYQLLSTSLAAIRDQL